MEHGSTYGRCKICLWDKAKELNKRIKQGHTEKQIMEWAATQNFKFDRKTLFSHKKHSAHPADALVSYADRTAAVATQTVTPQQLLGAITKIGFANIMADPSSITPNHALKAADLQLKQQSQVHDLFAIVAKAMMGARREDLIEVIDGEATEVA